MKVIYCLVHKRNNIDLEWVLVAVTVSYELRDAEELIENYKEKHFDIHEYRCTACNRNEFYQNSSFVPILVHPRLKGKSHGF